MCDCYCISGWKGSCCRRVMQRKNRIQEVGKERVLDIDPLFILPQFGKTMAQLSLMEKNRIQPSRKGPRKVEKIISTKFQVPNSKS